MKSVWDLHLQLSNLSWHLDGSTEAGKSKLELEYGRPPKIFTVETATVTGNNTGTQI
jgi:hypothetical protein